MIIRRHRYRYSTQRQSYISPHVMHTMNFKSDGSRTVFRCKFTPLNPANARKCRFQVFTAERLKTEVKDHT